MEFTIENGENICAIGSNGGCSYIRFEHPLTVVWYDCEGSIAKYFCSLPYNENYRTTVRERILNNLNKDFTNRIEDLYDVLKPLFPIFKNGKYNLQFYSDKEKEFFQYRSSFDDFKELHYENLEVIFSKKAVNNQKVNEVIEEHQQFLIENEVSKKFYPVKLLSYTTDGYYDSHSSFYATQPYENINQDRVTYYEKLIKNGEKPFAIIFNATDSFNFILDGHHKLLAYKKLKMYPPIAVITHLPESSEHEYDTNELSRFLYPWQINHIIENFG